MNWNTRCPHDLNWDIMSERLDRPHESFWSISSAACTLSVNMDIYYHASLHSFIYLIEDFKGIQQA